MSGSDGSYRIGVGAGFAGDRLDPAVDLVEQAALDALVFECLAERTIALAHLARLEGTGPGFDPLLTERIRTALPAARRNETVLITNAGAADPIAAARAVKDMASQAGVQKAPVAAVTGDDVLDRLDLREARIVGSDKALWDIKDRIVSANAYLGVAGIVEALEQDPAVVVTGRTADAALFLAPLMRRFGWSLADLNLVAAGTVVGHLLECAGQLTGGYFADGERKVVPGLARLGFPFADVASDGQAVFRKLPGTGGRLDRRTCLEQLLYEVDDPQAYLTPDVTLDMSHVRIVQTDHDDEVAVAGAIGKAAPETLKVSVGVRDGYVGEAEISYAGRGCLTRAQLAVDIVGERWDDVHRFSSSDITAHFIGRNSCRPWHEPDVEPPEVRLRLSVRATEREPAVVLAREVEALYTNGPAGGGGVTSHVRTAVGLVSTTIPRSDVSHEVTVLQ